MRREEFAFKSFYEPETNTREREEAVLKIGKDLKAVFEDALQYRFDKFEESHLLIWEDLFSWNFTRKERQFLLSTMMEDGEESTTYLSDKIRLLEDMKELLQDIEDLEEDVDCLLQYDDDGNLLVDENGCMLCSDNEDYAVTLDDVENMQSDIELLKGDLPENFPEDVSSYDCSSFIQYLKAFETYIEEGILPDFTISRIISKLLLLERMQEEEATKERVVDELFKGLSSEKAKSGWKYLLKKEVVVYNVKSGYLELSKEYMGKRKGGQEMLAFIGSYLANRFELKSIQDHGWNLEKVIEYDCTNKKDVCDMIGKLFGIEMKNKVKKPLEDGRRKGTNNGFVSPAKSGEVYEILKKFENEYEIKNK